MFSLSNPKARHLRLVAADMSPLISNLDTNFTDCHGGSAFQSFRFFPRVTWWLSAGAPASWTAAAPCRFSPKPRGTFQARSQITAGGSAFQIFRFSPSGQPWCLCVLVVDLLPTVQSNFLGSAAAPAAVNDALVADTNASHACFCLKGFRPPVCSARALNTARGARALPTP
jgi:hypothetical protein